MYRHTAEAIKESSDRMFISSEEKTKFNNYENTMRRKDDSYSKEEVDNKVNQIKNKLYESVECSHNSIDNTLDGYLKDVEILGNTIQDASNLADIRSVGDTVEGQELYEIPVLSCGKNLFNIDNISSNIVSKSNDIYEINTMTPVDLYNKGIFKAVKNVQYTVSYKAKLGTATNFRVDFVYTDGSFQQFSYCNSTTEFIQITKTSDKNKQLDYVRFNWTNAGTVYIKDIQIEEGTLATPYEPYQEDKLSILSPVQLEKVGDVADRIIEKDGVWGVEKNIKTVVFDGSESYWRGIMIDGGITNNMTYVSGTPFPLDNMSNRNGICDRLQLIQGNQFTFTGYNQIALHNSPIYSNYVYISTQCSSLEEFKQQLSANPITLLYTLKTPQFIPLPHDQQVKVRTFANKTNISFGCEIEGTIKAQVPKSLGATVNTHTEQINNLNKELDRVKKLEESTVSTVETESDFTTVEATSNGYFEDVKLEGKTLVNLAPKYSIKWTHSGTWLSTFLTGTKNPVTNDHYKVVQDLKPNTEYTVVVNVKTNTQSGNINLNNYQQNTCVFKDSMYIKPSDIGVKTFKVKTVESFDHISPSNMVVLRSQSAGIANGETLIEDIMILEGDHTQNPPSGYIEGLKSVGDGVDEIVVSSVNENLLNLVDLGYTMFGQFITIEHMDTNSIKLNTLSTNTNAYTSVSFDTFKFIPNVRYRIKAKYTHSDSTNAPFISVRKHGNNGIALKDMYGKNGVIEDTFVPTHTKHKIDFFTGNHKGTLGGTWVEFTDIQISIDNDDFSYFTQNQSDKKHLLYYNNETQTWEKPILREWDSIEKHSDGKYYYHQRSGEVVLNGSENWSPNSLNTVFYNNVKLLNVKAPISNSLSAYIPFLCDRLVPTNIDTIYNNNIVNGIGISKDSNIGVSVDGRELGTFKQWLQANNVTVVYQLAEEKVYECTNIDLITYANETNYIVECGAIVPKTTLKVHNNISNVVSLLQKKVSILESNQLEYQIAQNRILLNSKYTADRGEFRIDIINETYSIKTIDDIDLDTFYLTKAVIDSGKENYDLNQIESIIDFYTLIGKFSFEMSDYLFDLIDNQINLPVIETPEEEVTILP